MPSPSEIQPTSVAPQSGSNLELSGAANGQAAGDGLNLLSMLNQKPADSTGEVVKLPPAQQEVQTLLKLVAGLPNNVEVPVSQIQETLKQTGLGADPRVQSVLVGVTSIKKSGDTITLNRTHPTKINFNESLIDGAIKVNSLDLGNVSFKLKHNGSAYSMGDLQGLSLSVTAFGNPESLPIVGSSLTQDKDGNTVVTGDVKNPIPPSGQYVFDMKPTIPLSLTLGKDGQIKTPSVGDSLSSAANATGQTFPGMVLGNELNDAAAIANFAERYPDWMNNTVYPMINAFAGSDLKKALLGDTQQGSGNDSKPADGKPADAKPANANAPAKPPEQNNSDSSAKLPSDSSNKTTAKSDTTSDGLTPLPSHITKGGEYGATIKVDGEDRHYRLFVPSNYDPSRPMPLVLAIHGLGGNSAQFEKATGLDQLAEKEGFIVAYPDATKWLGTWTSWDTNNGIIPPGKSVDDTKFLRTIIDNTQKQGNVDADRIYLTGLSNGGMLTYDAVSALSDKIAAVAVISGAMSGRETSPKEPISVLNMHGTADTTIPYNGITDVPNVLSAIGIPTFQPFNYVGQYWTKEDGITGAPTTTTSGSQIFQDWVNPTDGAEVEQITNIGGPHVPKDTGTVMQEAWDFLDRHTKIKPDGTNTPPTIKPIVGEPVNPTNQIVDDLKKRGVTGIESDIDRVVKVLPSIEDGSISPEDLGNKVTSLINSKDDNPIISFLDTTQTMGKQGDHYYITRKDPAKLQIDYKFPGTGGLASLQDLSIGSTSFDMNANDDLLHINNLKGLTADLHVAGFNLKSNIHSVTEQKFNDGSREYKINVDQPLPGFLRTFLMAPDTMSIDVKFDASGNPQVQNEKQIEDQVIGANPFTHGLFNEATDVAKLVQNPNWGNGGNVAKDTAITTGLAIGGGILGSFLGGRTKLGVTAGLLLAPAAVDEIDKL
ncbi:MAG TPA: PHB depolymerase family esterase [Chroococcales cyanobacterium]